MLVNITAGLLAGGVTSVYTRWPSVGLHSDEKTRLIKAANDLSGDDMAKLNRPGF